MPRMRNTSTRIHSRCGNGYSDILLSRFFSLIHLRVHRSIMRQRCHLIVKYLRYWLTASNGKGHGTHSPFVFDFIINVLNDKTNYPAYSKVEHLRRQLIKDKTVLSVEDMGAGSVISKTNTRSVATIARHAAKPAKYGQLLYRMVRHYHAGTVLELGTSLGITTSYLALADTGTKLTTIEGAGSIAAVARQNFRALNIDNVSLVEGNFDDRLPAVLASLPTLDFCFIDGNHRREPTLRYFDQLLAKTGNDTILVFDDIHWSPEMENAWNTIKQHEAVRYTIDLFFVGLVFFRSEFREKQHFTIRF